MREYIVKFETDTPLSEIAAGSMVRAMIKTVGDCDEVIRCKNCKYDHTCTHMMVRKSLGGGQIYCPVTYCSEGKRKEE